jgi:hypothetical protein
MRIIILIVAIVALSSCTSPYITIKDETGKIHVIKDYVYSKHTNVGDSLVLRVNFLNNRLYSNIHSLKVGELPRETTTTFYYNAVRIK